MDLFDLYARITLDTQQYEQGIINAANSTSSLGSKLKSGLATAGSLAVKGITAVAGAATAAGGALLALEGSTEEYRIQQGKLNTAFEAAGYSTDTAQKAYQGFYGILGETDTAVEASQLLAQLSTNAQDMNTWIDAAAGIYGTFGAALPIEGLIESANETAKVGKVTGSLADALNWVGISEDEFNIKLAECTDESQRNQLIMETLSSTYDDASKAFYKNNEALVQARENQALLDKATGALGDTVAKVKNQVMSDFLPSVTGIATAFNDMLNGVEGADENLSNSIGELIKKVAERLPEFIDFGFKILEAIAQGIHDNIPTLANSASEIIVNLVNKLVEAAPSIFDGALKIIIALANGLLQALPELLAKIPTIIAGLVSAITANLPQLIVLGINIILTLVQGLIQAIPSLLAAIPQILIAIVEGFATALGGEQGAALLEVGTQLINSIVSGISEAWHLVTEFFGTAFEVLGQIFSTAWEGLKIITSTVLGGLVEIFSTIWEGIKNIFTGVAEFFSGVFTQAVEAIKAVWNGITEFFSFIWEGIKSIFSNVIDFYSSIFSSAFQAVQAIWSVAVSFFTTIWEGIQKVFSVVVDFFGDIFSKAWEGIKKIWSVAVDFFTDVWAGIQDVFSTVVEVLGGFFSAAWEVIKGVWNTAAEFFSTLLQAIVDIFSAAVETISGFFSAAWEAVKAGWGAAVDFFGGIWEGIKGVFSKAADTLGGFFQDAKEAIKGKWEDIKDFFSNIWESIKDVFAHVKETFLDIGGNIVKGIKDGVFKGWSGLTSWINEKVSGLIDAVKNKLGIRSPSRVFKAIGSFMAEGLGVGWDDEYSDVKKEIENGLNFNANSATVSLKPSTNSGIANTIKSGDTFNFYSPKALTPVESAREMKKAKQQMALGLVC